MIESEDHIYLELWFRQCSSRVWKGSYLNDHLFISLCFKYMYKTEKVEVFAFSYKTFGGVIGNELYKLK